MPYIAFNISNENLVVHQDNNFLVTYLLDNLLILYGKASYRSLLEINALTIVSIVHFVVNYCSFTSQTNMIHNLLHVSRESLVHLSTIKNPREAGARSSSEKQENPCQQFISLCRFQFGCSQPALYRRAIFLVVLRREVEG